MAFALSNIAWPKNSSVISFEVQTPVAFTRAAPSGKCGPSRPQAWRRNRAGKLPGKSAPSDDAGSARSLVQYHSGVLYSRDADVLRRRNAREQQGSNEGAHRVYR